VLTHNKLKKKKHSFKKTVLSKLVAACEVLKGQTMGTNKNNTSTQRSTTIADKSECQKNLTDGSSSISEDVMKENITPGAS